ncbi:MAG: metallophosphoesterase family protein [Desulfurococcus sp.]|uniref:metallophosphoesterase family protein n=1 Tax=Desulfurococcus sp. TaxID=51678 RepID=UPI003D119AAF
MNKWAMYILIIMVSLLVPPIATPLLNADTSTMVPLYVKTRIVIPGNLPWYPLIVIGDNRPPDVNAVDPPEVFYQAINEAENALPLAVIGLGDNVGLGTPEQYDRLYGILNKTRLENIWMIPGNHDVTYSGLNATGIDLWRQYIGSDNITIDDIPGWRIALINSEADITTWGNQVKAVYNYTGGKHLILGFHRPLYPNVTHNLKTKYDTVLLNYMNNYGWPALVLQAHFHAWVKYSYNNTEFLIVGSAGSPLYSCSDVITPGAECSSVYHYLVLILYPNGTYTYTPIALGDDSGTLKVIPLNATAYSVVNSKKNIYREPVEYPVRLRFTAGKTVINIVAKIPASASVVFSIDPVTHRLYISQNLDYYVYIMQGTSDQPIVINGIPEGLDLSQFIQGEEISVETPSQVVKTETVTSTTVAYITRTVTKPTTITETTTVTQPTTIYTTVSIVETQKITWTTTVTNTTTITETFTERISSGEDYIYLVIVLTIAFLTGLVYVLTRKKT